VISVADSGGSTGRLRDEFGFLPVGDLRQALAALSSDYHDSSIAKMLLYRFTKGSGLEGHNLGNLILTALQDLTGSTSEALAVASQIFRLKGTIAPVTDANIQLVIEYQDGTVEIGESVLDEKHGGMKITALKTSPRAHLSLQAKQAITTANAIVIGPGDLYGSLLPNLVIEDMPELLSQTQAPIIYLLNLMTHYTQTHDLTAKDHLDIIETYLKRPVDHILINNSAIPQAIQQVYQAQHEYPVKDDLSEDPRVLRLDLIKSVVFKPQLGDKLVRSYLRHDSDKVAAAILSIINKKIGNNL